ncbi:VOC family protein [Streptomyces sp. NPDC054787]
MQHHDGKLFCFTAALGWKIAQAYGDSAAMISDGSTAYVFYTAESFKAPNWPADELVFHLDLTFDDVAAAEGRLIGAGATKPAHQPGGAHWTVLLDPSGQPFCIGAAGPTG